MRKPKLLKSSLVQKLRFIITTSQKKQLIALGFLSLIGILFEMAGLGMLIPLLGIMLTPDIGVKYPILKTCLEWIGNPTQIQLVIGGMGVLVFVYFVKSVFLIFLTWRQSKFSTDLMAELGSKLFKGYLKQPYTFHLNNNSAFLIRNIHIDIAQFSNVSQAAITLSLEFSLLIGVAFLLFFTEPLGAMAVTVFLTISVIIFQNITKKKLLIWGKDKQTLSGFVYKDLQQGFGGVKDIKLLGRENQFIKDYDSHNLAYAKIMTRISTLNFVPRSYLELLAVIGLAGLIMMMVLHGKSLELLVPTLGVFVAAAFRMIPSVNRIMSSMQTIRFSRPVIDMLYQEFNMINQNANNLNICINNSSLEFHNTLEIKNISYKYPEVNASALSNVSFTIKKGQSIGFIGPSGSGKSTLVDLILGLLAPENGQILADGTDIQINMRSWQNQIGYVPQLIYLTDDSLRRNVAFGIPEDEIDTESVERAIKAAQLDEFVDTLPEKLETFVGERGVRLSGGQRQRIGIARALYHDPKILVLDEATSALDMDTESKVMEAVNKLKGTKTLILIAHRVSTLKNCDNIFKLELGKVVQ